MLNIQPQYVALANLLDRRIFEIPQYQRAYSWGSRQRQDLFNDLASTYEKGHDHGHFMSAVVCLRKRKQMLGTDEFQVLEIVDGQQRLTTIVLLLKSIVLALAGPKTQRNRGELEALLVKEYGDELLLLQTNHDSSRHFSNYLRTGEAPLSSAAKTIADKEILKAIEECQEFVAHWGDSGASLIELVALMKNRLFFLLHEIDDERVVYTVFEVLNSRGLEVSSIDKLKSSLMGSAFEIKNVNNQRIIGELHGIWRQIYSLIGLRQGLSTEALRFAATLKSGDIPSRPLGEEDAAAALLQQATDARQIIHVANWLLKVVNQCDYVRNQNRLNAVTRIAQARLLAVAICLRNDFADETRKELLAKWEKVTFRIYGMLGNDARTRVGDYVRLAWKVSNEKSTPDEIGSEIEAIGADFSITKAIKEMRGCNCYEGWETELRYLLFRYEENLARIEGADFCNEQWERIWQSSPSDSIEHILPQSAAGSEERHRLGNLVLLPPKLNSKLKDRAPREKSKEYWKTGLLIARDVASMIDSGGWTVRKIKSREAQILAWAKEEWGD